MPRIGRFQSNGVGEDQTWEHPDFSDSTFILLGTTGMSDVRWNDEPQPLDIEDSVLESIMEDINIDPPAGGSDEGVQTEYGWLSCDPRDAELYILVGLRDSRHPIGQPEIALFQRLES